MEADDQKRIVEMQESHDLFMVSLMLVLDISRRHLGDGDKKSREGVDEMIGMLSGEGVEAEKKGVLIKKVFMILDIYFDLLKGNDCKLFNLYTKHKGKAVRVRIIPGIDFWSLWDRFDDGVRGKIWDLIKLMYVASSYMINSSGNSNNVVNLGRIEMLRGDVVMGEGSVFEEFWKVYPNCKMITRKGFNPFVGVGENNKEYGLKDLLGGPKLLPEQTGCGIDGISKLLGIDKMINMEDLAKQLKNITKEQIEAATKSIKGMLGDVDENTSEMIDLMLTDITDELKKEELGNGNPLNNLVKIAENVAHKIMPKIDSKKVDMTQVWNSTRNMASKCQDKDGKPIFDGPNNPLAMVSSLLEKQMNMNQFGSGKNSGGKKKGMTEEEYVKECQDILNELGLPNISPEKMKNVELSKLMSELGPRQGVAAKKKKSKRK
ncbi:MAG: hypothetical protein Hyperionvirus44_9 [Hyperionvirus sp.]|uniref:Uncharacterized protein n=1 Tax=Hyperionvirus sp. TaxID=2487770 RepID=A0A3G5AEZ7_9VIRU|nr:MAG: hypothetical protein Hyperionvirus44_9 [Hyperionvirus sp.]